MSLSDAELARYDRQIIMPEIEVEGQEKLKKSRVFIAGLGGLGSISASYLVAAGIGHIRMVDGDRVTPGNLNRQILHWTGDVGRAKTDSAVEKLQQLNPDCQIESFDEIIGEDNVLELISDCDLIMDATDNLETRKLLNHVSVRKKIPLIFGGVEGLNGMITTFIPEETGCLECLFPFSELRENPIGVIAPLPGLIASIQALEAIKFVLEMGGLLKSRLFYINGADMSFKFVRIEKNPDCCVCGRKRES